MSKKGLAVIYDPHNVYQFLWYYCTYGKDIEWYALCLPNSYKGEYLSSSCEKLGIFKKVFKDTKPFDAMPLAKRLGLFLKMFLYALVGQQKRFVKKFIGAYIDRLDFDTAVILTDVGFVSGMFCQLGKEKEIVILEDGTGDYLTRKWSNIFSHFHNFFDFQGFLLSALGYSNVGHCFPLRTTKNCIKFCSHPEKMPYKKYKEMKILFDMSNTDINLFQKYTSILYPGIGEYFSGNIDLIFFTTPLTDYVVDVEPFVKATEVYIGSRFKSVIIKRHPRDKAVYDFGKNVSVSEIDQKIPAEVMLPYLKGYKIIFMQNSSTNLYMDAFGYTPDFFYFNQLEAANKKEKNILCQYPNRNEFENQINLFSSHGNVIELDVPSD